MKTNLTRWMIAAAVLAVAAGNASAQIYKAEIPLSFHVRDKLMSPGEYRLRISNTSIMSVVEIYNANTRAGALLTTPVIADAPQAWRETGTPVISFECNGGVCAISRIWNGADGFIYKYPGLKLPPGDSRMAVVTVPLARAD